MIDKADTPATREKEESPGSPRVLPPEARRALAEAVQRRRNTAKEGRAPEVDGRGGLDPARYGDWEVKGLATDF